MSDQWQRVRVLLAERYGQADLEEERPGQQIVPPPYLEVGSVEEIEAKRLEVVERRRIAELEYH